MQTQTDEINPECPELFERINKLPQATCRLEIFNSLICKGLEKDWSREWELNPRPADYESAALPLSYLGPL